MRNNGAATPPKNTIAASQRRSERLSAASLLRTPAAPRANRHAARPMPDPKYNNPANSHGLTFWPISFANGVLTPKRSAAPTANPGPTKSAKRCAMIVHRGLPR